MNQTHFCFLLMIVLFLQGTNLQAQLATKSYQSTSLRDIDKRLRPHFQSNDIVIKSVSFSGSVEAIAEFSEGKDIIGMRKGLLLSTGNAANAKNFNNEAIAESKMLNLDGHPKATKIAGKGTYDAAVIKVTFVPKKSYLSFNFVFASEEYLEFVNSGYNDVFAFILSKPGGKGENLAIIPETGDPITINNVNPGKNAQYYINNCKVPKKMQELSDEAVQIDTLVIDISATEQALVVRKYQNDQSVIDGATKHMTYDGYTKVLQANAEVEPGKAYMLEIIIADSGDGQLDSGVFIESGSFTASDDENFKTGALSDASYYYEEDTLAVFPKKNLENYTNLSPEQIAAFMNDNTLETPIPKEEPVVEADTSKEEVILPTVEIEEVDCYSTSRKVFFAYNQSNIDAENENVLVDLVKKIAHNQDWLIELEGYADVKGTNAYNLDLSKKRAETIQNYLIDSGVDAAKIKINWYGEEQSQNYTQKHQEQRRVDIRLRCPE